MAKIINISEAASLAIHSMALIAKTPEMLNVNEIAELTHASRNHLAKVMQALVKNDFLSSIRGPHGGFALANDPSNISLLDVYEAIDGKYHEHYCGIEEGKCPFTTCVYGPLAGKFTSEFYDYLKNKKLSEIL